MMDLVTKFIIYRLSCCPYNEHSTTTTKFLFIKLKQKVN